MTDCSCPDVKALLYGAIHGHQAPPCALHRPASAPEGPAVALNDDEALLGRVKAAVGLSNLVTPAQEGGATFDGS